jgi:hypothetical protein
MNTEREPAAGPAKPAKSVTRSLWTLPELAAEAKVCRRLIELEIARGRLQAVRISNRIRVRDHDWRAYLDRSAT